MHIKTHPPTPLTPPPHPPPTELADVGVRESMLATSIPERAGTFIDLVDCIMGPAGGEGISVTELKYR